ncbi:helix-turn-helix domain-containing protein [Clostridium chauvoei]|uniref:TetR/AcrR family transcriptional regulator n=4 Tax=Clostridium chauvoei TaxID=46867 RepID=A0ABD4REW0_9CLOT|nr:TetR/AcrR family transcriptional regulator [Clostridium chauvoei]ATD56194.1 hypothetical protein BTM20_05170 [Clostridium chauvoei]ATD58708.1 hypothetical protein BTM21_07885 [Clostridium chauvoei]MBX7279954.1 TetR/AcrR family transcriptional regulator [Clostridium chauvoei]MBX7282387.1 TetR/AcrR family transcriptional regulator [Clostridium chauvoei]MBX7284845.1 TetR/AcrR family transcriptional regulator [Clostridium chauvoei]
MPKIIKNVRALILSKGKNLLIEKSYSEFNIRELAKLCDVSVGTIYNQFDTKEKLISSIFIDDWNKSLSKIENLNSTSLSLEKKLFSVYKEMNIFISTYISIFHDIFVSNKSHKKINHLDSLYKLVGEILYFEKEKGNITSQLSIEKLTYFTVNNLIVLCKDKTLSFEETYSLIKFN